MRWLSVIGIGFLAGAVAVLAVHQPLIGLLHAFGLVGNPPYNLRPVAPFGVGQVWSTAFWGGLWGIALALAETRQRLLPTVLFGLLFGAVFPVLAGWFVVAPLKGLPVAAGWNPARMWLSPVINGAWGLGAAVLWKLGGRRG